MSNLQHYIYGKSANQ